MIDTVARTMDEAEVVVSDILKSASIGDPEDVASCRKALKFLADDASKERELVANGVAAFLTKAFDDYYVACLERKGDAAFVITAMTEAGLHRRACKAAFEAAGRAHEFAVAYAAAALRSAA